VSEPKDDARGDAEARRDGTEDSTLRAPAPPREIEPHARGDAETRREEDEPPFLRAPAPPREIEFDQITGTVIDAAIQLHRDLGPGLLESVYETVLARMLQRRGLHIERQLRVVFEYDGMRFDDGLRIDLLVEGCVIVELKSVETLAPVHSKQVLTYLKLMHLPVGLLINFGGATLKEGLRRIVNDFPAARSSLRVNAGSRGDAEARRDGTESSTLRAPAPPREIEKHARGDAEARREENEPPFLRAPASPREPIEGGGAQ